MQLKCRADNKKIINIINTTNCSLSRVLKAKDQKSLKRSHRLNVDVMLSNVTFLITCTKSLVIGEGVWIQWGGVENCIYLPLPAPEQDNTSVRYDTIQDAILTCA